MNIKWKTQGKIIARGEDGVPWELYENGYFLFKPTKEKNTLSNRRSIKRWDTWQEKYGYTITAIGFTDTVYAPQNSSHLFSLPNVEYIESEKIDTSNVVNMEYMFCKAYSLIYLDVSKWNTSNVTDMSNMFNEAQKLTYLDVSNWDTRNVESMGEMFCNTISLTCLNISNWDTSNVINMALMFSYAKSLITLDLSNWNTSNVMSIYAMFQGAIKLKTLNISNWNISCVEKMSYLFYENDNLKLVDCSEIKNSQEITDSFKRLINENKLQLNNDCVIVLPN